MLGCYRAQRQQTVSKSLTVTRSGDDISTVLAIHDLMQLFYTLCLMSPTVEDNHIGIFPSYLMWKNRNGEATYAVKQMHI